MSPASSTSPAQPRSTWQPSVAGAQRAAERAMRAATVAVAWAARAGTGQAEAAEAMRAGECARFAADRAAAAPSLDEMLGHARTAELAARAALEADRRVGAAIAASLWSAEDVRLALRSRSLESAA